MSSASSRKCCLELTVCIWDTQHQKERNQLTAITLGWVVCHRPASGCDQFISRGLEKSQVIQVLAGRCLVDRRVELETDLIQSRRDEQGETAISPNLASLDEASWKTEIHQASRAGIEPVLSNSGSDADVPGSHQQRGRKHFGLTQPLPIPHRDDIEVTCRPNAQPLQKEAGAADSDKGVCKTAGLKDLAEPL